MLLCIFPALLTGTHPKNRARIYPITTVMKMKVFTLVTKDNCMSWIDYFSLCTLNAALPFASCIFSHGLKSHLSLCMSGRLSRVRVNCVGVAWLCMFFLSSVSVVYGISEA